MGAGLMAHLQVGYWRRGPDGWYQKYMIYHHLEGRYIVACIG